FFFSSRRRHTRWPRDWSSDVCSSDLVPRCISKKPNNLADIVYIVGRGGLCSWYVNRTESPTTEQETVVGTASIRVLSNNATAVRSEERRVGKECRCWCAPSGSQEVDK